MNKKILPRFELSAAGALALAFVALSSPAHAAATNGVDGLVCRACNSNGAGLVQYQGTDGNWFNPANWSTGRVPGADDSVQLDGDDYVLIDPNAPGGTAVVSLENVFVSSVATLEVVHGAVVQTRDQVLSDDGQIIFRASGDVGETIVVEDTCIDCLLVQNPNPKKKRTVVLKSSVTTDMGLGGTQPASVSQDANGQFRLAAGPGHYSTLTVDTAVLAGDLKLSTYYGFNPMPGEQYQIITVNGRRSGEFTGIPEGGYVGCTDDNVGLRLSYEGGDGNDLVISAEQTEPGICLLLPAVQKVREAAARMHKPLVVTKELDKAGAVDQTTQTREHILLARQVGIAIDDATTQTREHILLARQVGVPSVTETKTKLPAPTTPISGPKPPKK